MFPACRSFPHAHVLARDPHQPPKFCQQPWHRGELCALHHHFPPSQQDPARDISEIKTLWPRCCPTRAKSTVGTQPSGTGIPKVTRQQWETVFLHHLHADGDQLSVVTAATGEQDPHPVVPKPCVERPQVGMGLAALNPKTLCSSRKALPRQQQVGRGERGSLCPPASPHHSWGRTRDTHRSSWEGWMYPEERMFRDRMLGSMRDSSASGVFRIRPASTARGHHSGNRPVKVPRRGRGSPSACIPSSPITGSSRPALSHSSPWTWRLGLRSPVHTACLCHLLGSHYFAIAGWEVRQGIKPHMGTWARNRLRGCSGTHSPPSLAQLTHNQLPHFLPADEAACFVHQGDGDSPLDPLKPTRPERKGSG